MIGYLDSSVLLRALLNQKGKLGELSQLKRPIASRLLKTECLRTLDRLRTLGSLSEDEFITAVEDLYEVLESIEFIEITDIVLERAGNSLPVALGTLDAIHLVSAILWREQFHESLTFLTHDVALAKAAIVQGFQVIG